MKRCSVILLFLLGCAVPSRREEPKRGPVAPASAPVPAQRERQLVVFIPQTDEAAANWLKWFAKWPELRMVIAVSPRFQKIAKDPILRLELQALLKQRRLEMALQIPNAPILPLLMDTTLGKDALPPGSEVPSPSYAYPDDVIQLIALSKAGFFRQWNVLPAGLVLPHGAADPKLLSMLERLGFSWVVGALGAPATNGPYQAGSMAIWDGAPSVAASPGLRRPLPGGEGRGEATVVRVWDERDSKINSLEAWVKEAAEMHREYLLPSDTGIAGQPWGPGVAFKRRSWTADDWALWIGGSSKNAAWVALRKTREALEAYKNSGQASVQRLDMAFDEIYGAQNSNYFASLGSVSLSPALVEDREHEFRATLLAVYRLIGQTPPEDLFPSTTSEEMGKIHASSTTARAETLPDGREYVVIEDSVGDAMGGPNSPDLKSLEVWASTTSTVWSVTLAAAVSAVIDIYVDQNGQPNAGTPHLLPGRDFGTSPLDAWEYAITLSGSSATLYRTQGMGTYGSVETFPLVSVGNSLRVTLPRNIIRGSPKRWGFQVLVMTPEAGGANGKLAVTDILDPLEIPQKELWQDLVTGQRSEIPFVRIRPTSH
jgi:hypothetical protein